MRRALTLISSVRDETLRTRRLRHPAFTLVELMIVIAIVMILAAIAVPMLQTAQLKAKRAETYNNVPGIILAQTAYHAASDTYIDALVGWPAGAYGKAKKVWGTGSTFDALGWKPDGDVYGKYTSDAVAGGAKCPTGATAAAAEAHMDLDGDGGINIYSCCVTGAYNDTYADGDCAWWGNPSIKY